LRLSFGPPMLGGSFGLLLPQISGGGGGAGIGGWAA
jgi:hypothetical protein